MAASELVCEGKPDPGASHVPYDHSECESIVFTYSTSCSLDVVGKISDG